MTLYGMNFSVDMRLLLIKQLCTVTLLLFTFTDGAVNFMLYSLRSLRILNEINIWAILTLNVSCAPVFELHRSFISLPAVKRITLVYLHFGDVVRRRNRPFVVVPLRWREATQCVRSRAAYRRRTAAD